MFDKEKQVSDELAAVKKDLGRLQADLSGLVSAIHASGKAKVEGAQDAVMSELEEALLRLRAGGNKLVSGAEHEVVKHPMTALAAAVGVGFLLGKLTSK